MQISRETFLEDRKRKWAAAWVKATHHSFRNVSENAAKSCVTTSEVC